MLSPALRWSLALVAAVLPAVCAAAAETEAPAAPAPVRPNIVLIYADDLGWGDPACYGGGVKTPEIDALAAAGLRFTAGYAASATCTPSRFALLTGALPWRQKGTGILPGDAALIIKPGSVTLPAQLKAAGYATAAVGKWHLGLGDGSAPIDWNTEIKPGPEAIGFDHSFLIPATVDRTPCVFVRNGRVENLDPADPITVDYQKRVGSEPTGKANPELLKMGLTRGHDATIVNGISRIGWMAGGRKARWVDEDIADTLVKEADAFITASRQVPFFLYFATHDVHVPRAPHPRFVGKSGMGPRGDAIVQFDWQVGAVRESLRRNGLLDNTLIILSSDNGPVLDDGYRDQAAELLGAHKPAGPWSGGKYSLFEGGTRVPFIVSWPARVKPGVSDAIVGQVDLLASLSSLTGAPALPADAAPDSTDQLPALLGAAKEGRAWILENIQGGGNALRMGDWKLIPGGSSPRDPKQAAPRLCNLAQDPGEKDDRAGSEPAKLAEMQALLRRLETSARTR